MASTEDRASAAEQRKAVVSALQDEYELMGRHVNADTGKRRQREVADQLKEYDAKPRDPKAKAGADKSNNDSDDADQGGKGPVETADAGPGGNTGRSRRS